MSEKRYGALNAFGGWDLATLANGPHHTSLAQELARDLIAAQRECQRWAQWAADVSGADVRLSNDELMDQVGIKVVNAEREEAEAANGWNAARARITELEAKLARASIWATGTDGREDDLTTGDDAQSALATLRAAIMNARD